MMPNQLLMRAPFKPPAGVSLEKWSALSANGRQRLRYRVDAGYRNRRLWNQRFVYKVKKEQKNGNNDWA